MRAASRALAAGLALLAGCSKPPPPGAAPAGSASASGAASASASAPVATFDAGPLPSGATPCPGTVPCLRFATPEAAFRHVLATRPLVLGVGESHAPAGAKVPSSTARFTGALLPLVAPEASDIVVELWAPDPRCAKDVKAVASAQRPVVEAQAETNQNEYVTLGTKAKEAGVTPWLLRPTCDDFAALADAGADAVGSMLGLVRRLTQAKVTQLHARSPERVVIAYGGAMHNDLAPPEATREYSFGPDLDRLVGGRYVELDLIVPEFVKPTPVWEKLPWYPSFAAERAADAEGQRRAVTGTTLYRTGERSFVLVFPSDK